VVGGIETTPNLSHELHQQLEGEVIPIGDILEMDIPLEMFFDGTIPRTPLHICRKDLKDFPCT